jgi:hypothetical protein
MPDEPLLEPDMSPPTILPLIPAGPEVEPAERDRAAERLQALQARLPKLLFAAPRDAGGVASLARLARQINGYLDVTGATLRALVPAGPAGLQDRRTTATAQASLARISADTGRLIGVLDAFLADPDAEASRLALEEAVTQVAGSLPEGPRAWSSQPKKPQAEPAGRPLADEPPPAVPRSFDAAVRAGMPVPLLQRLRRQTHLALGLAGLALVLAGLALGLLSGGDHRQGAGMDTGTWSGPAPFGQDPGWSSPAGTLKAGLASQGVGLSAEEVGALAQVPERQAELEMEVLHLRARMEALEKQQEGADRARARAQNAADGE